jgi:NAD+-dependent protein deacetylase sirtuin 4
MIPTASSLPTEGQNPHQPLLAALREGEVVVLTGAGCSTASGIPDYRGEGTARRARRAMQHRDFLEQAQVRKRYWARSLVGWQRVAYAIPNPAHLALAQLERAGRIRGVITQNVDRLHQRAGSRRVVELHGTVAKVRCLSCQRLMGRPEFQKHLLALNPGAMPHGPVAPDGDAELEAPVDFVVPDCSRCGGILKPDVVFFGGSVKKSVLADAWDLYAGARTLLVVGSSLTVFSGFRFVRRAVADSLNIGIINLMPTRGDAMADFCLRREAGATLAYACSQVLQ